MSVITTNCNPIRAPEAEPTYAQNVVHSMSSGILFLTSEALVKAQIVFDMDV